jgi:hypothetical protein
VAKDKSEFLYGPELSNRIRKICEAANVDCAVAFWGVGMRDHLFPKWGDGKVRIVCDISMGATCRAALDELGAPLNKNLRVHNGLHGKIYLSPRGVVIGSPNASDNGVGTVAGAGGKLLETAVFCPAGSEVYLETARWFDELFQNAPVVCKTELSGAPERSGELRQRFSRTQLAALSLLNRLKCCPQNFPKLHIAVATGKLNDKKSEQSKRARAANHRTESNDDVVFQKDESDNLITFTGPLLLLWRENKGRAIKAYTYINCSTWPPTNPDTAFGIEDSDGFWKELGQEPPKILLTRDDAKMVEKILNSEDRQLVFTPEEFSERLKALQV